METVQELLAHPMADTVMLLVGVLLVIVGFVQVVRKGLSLVLWLALFGIGLFSVTYVFKGSDIDFMTHTQNQVADFGSLVPGIRDDVLELWCTKLDEAGL